MGEEISDIRYQISGNEKQGMVPEESEQRTAISDREEEWRNDLRTVPGRQEEGIEGPDATLL